MTSQSAASTIILVLGVLVFIVSLIALIRHSIARQRLAATSGALLSNSRETVVRYTNRTPRYDPWGFEMKEAVLATVDDQIPSLYEVVLDEKGGSGTDYEPAAGLYFGGPHPQVRTTYLVCLPHPPDPIPIPDPPIASFSSLSLTSTTGQSLNGSSISVRATSSNDSQPPPEYLELATETFDVDSPTSAELGPIGTPLFRPTTRTEWVRTGRRRELTPGFFFF